MMNEEEERLRDADFLQQLKKNLPTPVARGKDRTMERKTFVVTVTDQMLQNMQDKVLQAIGPFVQELASQFLLDPDPDGSNWMIRETVRAALSYWAHDLEPEPMAAPAPYERGFMSDDETKTIDVRVIFESE